MDRLTEFGCQSLNLLRQMINFVHTVNRMSTIHTANQSTVCFFYKDMGLFRLLPNWLRSVEIKLVYLICFVRLFLSQLDASLEIKWTLQFRFDLGKSASFLLPHLFIPQQFFGCFACLFVFSLFLSFFFPVQCLNQRVKCILVWAMKYEKSVWRTR